MIIIRILNRKKARLLKEEYFKKYPNRRKWGFKFQAQEIINYVKEKLGFIADRPTYGFAGLRGRWSLMIGHAKD